jgi:hypothetical protein
MTTMMMLMERDETKVMTTMMMLTEREEVARKVATEMMTGTAARRVKGQQGQEGWLRR